MPRFDAAPPEPGWDDDRKRDFERKKKVKTHNEGEDQSAKPTFKKNRRESGRSWRDYTVEEDEGGNPIDLDGADGGGDDDDEG
jgi:hypothetical protein